MNRLQRYVWRQALIAFLAGAAGLAAMIWVTQALRQIDVLTAKGQSLAIFFALTALAMPALLVVVMPIALFGATAFVLNRLNGDSELVAFTAAGVSPGTLLKPFLALAALVFAVTAYLTLDAMPRSFGAIEALATHLNADLIGSLVRPGAFVELESGFVFHVRERSPDGALHGLFIQDRRDPAHVTTYFAETGLTIERNGRNYLTLSHGTYQRPEGSGDSAFVTFDDDALDLTQLAPKGQVSKRPRERSTLELLTYDAADPALQRQAGRLRAELAERLTGPLYAFVAVAIAFAALGRPRTTRQGRTLALVGGAAAFATARMAGVGAVNLAAGAPWGAGVAYALPILATLAGLVVALGLALRARAPLAKWAAA